MSYLVLGMIWLAIIVVGVIFWKKVVSAWTVAVFNNIEHINKVKDVWMETRIKQYANDVRQRHPKGLKWWERIFAPLIVRRYVGTVANLISVIRILLAVIIALLLVIHYSLNEGLALIVIVISLLLFIIAGLLDLLDGPAARALQEVSESGKILDPLADKTLLASVFMIMGYSYAHPSIYWIVIVQETFLMTITIMKVLAKRLPFIMASQANMFGKIKNIFELVGGGVLFLCPLSTNLSIVANILFAASVPLAMGSIIGYLSSIKKKI